MIISIIIINSTNNTTTQVLIAVTSTLIVLIQLFIKPYKRRILNSLDGLISQVTIIVTVTSFIDSFSTGLLLSIIILLVILPLIAFVTMELIVYNENIKNIITYFKPKPDTTNPNLILQMTTMSYPPPPPPPHKSYWSCYG